MVHGFLELTNKYEWLKSGDWKVVTGNSVPKIPLFLTEIEIMKILVTAGKILWEWNRMSWNRKCTCTSGLTGKFMTSQF